MRVLITGICGFIGNALNGYLRARFGGDVEIWGIDNYSTGVNMDGVDRSKFIEGDVCDASVFERLPDVDYIFHLACPASPRDYHRLSLETMQVCSMGVVNVMLYMQSCERRPVMVFTSSSEVYGDPAVHPQVETYSGNVDVSCERSLYGEGKRFAEALIGCFVRENGLDVRVARLFNVYGPGMKVDDGRIIPAFISAAGVGMPMVVYGRDVSRTYCHVDDMVRMLCELAIKVDWRGGGSAVNLGSDLEDNEITNYELAMLIRGLVGSESDIVMGERRDGDPRRRRPDLSRARDLLGDDVMGTRLLSDGLNEMIRTMRQLG